MQAFDAYTVCKIKYNVAPTNNTKENVVQASHPKENEMQEST